MKTIAILLTSGDGYEALYINNELVLTGKPINQGFSRTKFFLNLSKKYNFNLEEMQEVELNEKDNLVVEDSGEFFQQLSLYTTIL